MPSDVGSQKVSLLFHTIANSGEWNVRYTGIRKVGIYSGGWLSVVDASNAQISPLICEISDGTYQVKVQTSDPVNLAVSSITSYVVLRWTYAGAVSDYMELLAVLEPSEYDLVVGKCTFSGGGELNGFTYADASYPRSNPNVQDLFLKVEETGDSDLRVRVRGGRIQTAAGNVAVADQKSGLFTPPASDSKVFLVYLDADTGAVDIDTSGVAAASPSPPDYDGKLVIAEVTLTTGDTSIPQSQIKDVRNFITKSVADVAPDGVTIEENDDGDLRVSRFYQNYIPKWRVKVANTQTYTLPSQFVSPLVTFGRYSPGSIVINDSSDIYCSLNSTLFEMKVYAVSNITKTLKLFRLNNRIYVYLRGSTSPTYSRTTSYSSPNSPIDVNLTLTTGENLIQVVLNDTGGAAWLALMGDIVDNSAVYFMPLT
jgi:hypothetical protein